jgi:hypothetical protein
MFLINFELLLVQGDRHGSSFSFLQKDNHFSQQRLLLSFAFSFPAVWYAFHGFVCFHFLCAEFLGESFTVVAWWSYIVLVSAFH